LEKYVYLDFEFNQTTEEKLNLVCVSIREDDNYYSPKSFWLHKEKVTPPALRRYLEAFHERGAIFVAYGVMAESRSLLALGMDVSKLRWIDLYCENLMLLNHFNEFQFGKQLVGGRVVDCRRPLPKYERVEGETSGPQVNASLASACFKFLGKEIDTEEKEDIRNLIISCPKDFSTSEKQKIINYCNKDTALLKPLHQKIVESIKKYLHPSEHGNLEKFMLFRGEWAARNAMIENAGYPIDYKATRGFADSVPDIMKELYRDINKQFNNQVFKYNPKTNEFSWNQKFAREQIAKTEYAKRWMKTKTKQLSLSLDAFQRFYSFQHDYPRENFGAQMVRFLKTKQSLNGFPYKETKKKTFWDSVGSDHRARPFLNIYGSQSGRNQPSSTGFIFLKAAWMRSLVKPKRFRTIIGLDFSSEEFLIAALLSGDKNMIKAYESGDVYLYFAKAARAVPQDATKESHGAMRDIFKEVVLSTQYQKTAYGLSITLTEKAGRFYDEDEAEEFLEMFEEAFPVYSEWRDVALPYIYEKQKYIILQDGWMMGPDNENFRSVANIPVQGAGSSILRYSVRRAQDYGLKVIITLHDAIYIECEDGEVREHIPLLAKAMTEGFKDYFRGTNVESLANIRLEGKAWGSKWVKAERKFFRDPEIPPFPVDFSEIHIDKRAKSEYEKFSKYFSRSSRMSLLDEV